MASACPSSAEQMNIQMNSEGTEVMRGQSKSLLIMHESPMRTPCGGGCMVFRRGLVEHMNACVIGANKASACRQPIDRARIAHV